MTRDPYMIHKDINHRRIQVGAYITYAASWGRCPVLKFGRVTKLLDKDGQLKIQVISFDHAQSKNIWLAQSNGRAITLSMLDRLLVVDLGQVPMSVQAYFLRTSRPELRRHDALLSG